MTSVAGTTCKCADKLHFHRAKTLLKKVELVTHAATRSALNKLKIFWFTRAEQKVWKIIFVPQEVQAEGMGYLK